jgi:hypothetical protein
MFNHNKFNDTLLNAFAKQNIPLNLAIIPYDENWQPFSPDTVQVNLVRQGIKNKTIDVQLHGFNHVNNGLGSEFQGDSLKSQFKRISLAKYYLDSLLDTDIQTFVPPMNTYDSTTLLVLDSLKIGCISGNKWGIFSASNIQYLPCTYEGFSEIPKIFRENKDQDALIIVLIHQYAFEPYKADYPTEKINIQSLDSLLGWINSNKIKCNTFSEIIGNRHDFDKARNQANIAYSNSISNYISAKVRHPLLNANVYYSKKYLNVIRIFDFIVWTVIFVIAFSGIYLFFRIVRFTRKLQLLCLTCLFIVSILAFIRRDYSTEWLTISNISFFLLLSAITVIFFTSSTPSSPAEKT